MKGSLLLFNLKLNRLIFFSTSLNSSLIIFIRIYTINYRNALDGLSVRMNSILFVIKHVYLSVFHSANVPRCKKFKDMQYCTF